MRDHIESPGDIKNRIYLLSVEIKEMKKEIGLFKNNCEPTFYGLLQQQLIYKQLKKIETVI